MPQWGVRPAAVKVTGGPSSGDEPRDRDEFATPGARARAPLGGPAEPPACLVAVEEPLLNLTAESLSDAVDEAVPDHCASGGYTITRGRDKSPVAATTLRRGVRAQN